jgi:hypothetical protein
MASEMLGQYHRSHAASQAKNEMRYEMILCWFYAFGFVAKNQSPSGISYEI